MNFPYFTCFISNNQPGIWKSFEEITSSFLLGDTSCKAGSSGCMAQSCASIARFIAVTAFILLSAFTDIPLVYLAPVFALFFGAFNTEISSAASDPAEEPEPVYADESEATLSPDPDDEPVDEVRPSVRFSGVDSVYTHDVSIIMGPNLTDRKDKKCTGYQVVLGRNNGIVTQSTDYRDKGREPRSRKTADIRKKEAMEMHNSGMFNEDAMQRFHADAVVENEYNIKLNRLNATETYLSALAREIGGNEIGRNEVAMRYSHLSLEWIDDGYEWFVAINPEAPVMSFDSMTELWDEVYLSL